MADSAIEWTDATWNPVAGCSVITPGCSNCYAMRMAARLDAMGQKKYKNLTRRSGGRAVWTGQIIIDEDTLLIPKKWPRPKKIFVNSMSDLFHEKVPSDFIAKVWDTMAETPQHTYQILTKRPKRMRQETARLPRLSNVWLGTSVEDAAVLERLDDLRAIDAAVRFVSFEPLIGSVRHANLVGLNWAIVGGESGPNSRMLEKAWVEEIELLCRIYKVAFFFKQWGGVNKKLSGRLLNGKFFDEMPAQNCC